MPAAFLAFLTLPLLVGGHDRSELVLFDTELFVALRIDRSAEVQWTALKLRLTWTQIERVIPVAEEEGASGQQDDRHKQKRYR